MVKFSANSGDPDQTPHSAIPNLGLHFFANFSLGCLQTKID